MPIQVLAHIVELIAAESAGQHAQPVGKLRTQYPPHRRRRDDQDCLVGFGAEGHDGNGGRRDNYQRRQ